MIIFDPDVLSSERVIVESVEVVTLGLVGVDRSEAELVRRKIVFVHLYFFSDCTATFVETCLTQVLK